MPVRNPGAPVVDAAPATGDTLGATCPLFDQAGPERVGCAGSIQRSVLEDAEPVPAALHGGLDA